MTTRLQLALNVSDVDKAVDFYSKFFKTEPAKREPGYANFAIADPPLKLVLFESADNGSINHIGVEAETQDEVTAWLENARAAGLPTTEQAMTDCCYARQSKGYIAGSDGHDWEVYSVLEDLPNEGQDVETCCAPLAEAAAQADTSSQTCC